MPGQHIHSGPSPDSNKFRDRVIHAAEAALAAGGSVGPLELLQSMRLLEPSHVDSWRRGRLEVLEEMIQGSPEKLERIFRYFGEWIRQNGLKPIPAEYLRAGRHGQEPLRVTKEGDPEEETFYHTHFAPADLPERKARQLEAKLKKAPDLVVFQTVSEEVICSECRSEMGKGDLLFMEKGQPLCLACADLDHLVFLPSGDATLSRRARKHSSLSAVVVRFSRARKRYERQGLMVTEGAIEKAEAECLADAPERSGQRAKAAERRIQEDVQFVNELSDAIRRQYPHCPHAEAEAIAQHTALRRSGRVGRSAAGRALDPAAVTLAVVAHVRHEHTNYDELLMTGLDRASARASVREAIDDLLVRWEGS